MVDGADPDFSDADGVFKVLRAMSFYQHRTGGTGARR